MRNSFCRISGVKKMTVKPLILRIKRIRSNAIMPEYKSAEAAGMDVAACIDDESDGSHSQLLMGPGDIAMIPTGLVLDIPPGHEVQVRPRSGMAIKHGITVVNSPGTIDSDYRGEVMVGLINHSQERFVIDHGMRIAQLVLSKVERMDVEEVVEVSDTERGADGFGSTGDK